MKEFSYTIKDELGIHARPAGLLVKQLQAAASSVQIARGEASCDGKKLLALMKLQIKCGETITVKVDGSDEESVSAAAEAFLKAHL